jgi:hypothetical protein
LEHTTAELLIFGSSSANHHYNPKIFEETLNLTTYNEGRDGIEILYHTAILKGILKRYTPKIVILNLAINELSTNQSYDRLSSLLPYVRKYPEMKEIISLKSKFESRKLYSRIYPYNSTFFTILNGLHRIINLKTQDKGYVPVYGTINKNNLIKDDYKNYPLDTNRVKALNDFIEECTKRKISVYIVFSPVFDFNISDTQSMIESERLANEKGVYFYNFTNDTQFRRDNALFKDYGHMNQEGANKFSKNIASIIFNNLANEKTF